MASLLFFFLLAHTCLAGSLAMQLYQESDWRQARIEALRQQLSDPTNQHYAAIEMLAGIRLNPQDTQRIRAAHARVWDDPATREWVRAELQSDCPPPPPFRRPALWGHVATACIHFYQNQISPAIGQRCSMYPSGSRYCIQASRQYGLLGIPMTADRLIRETDHVRHRINPIQVNGREHYYNPVSDHTFWFRRYHP